MQIPSAQLSVQEFNPVHLSVNQSLISPIYKKKKVVLITGAFSKEVLTGTNWSPVIKDHLAGGYSL